MKLVYRYPDGDAQDLLGNIIDAPIFYKVSTRIRNKVYFATQDLPGRSLGWGGREVIPREQMVRNEGTSK